MTSRALRFRRVMNGIRVRVVDGDQGHYHMMVRLRSEGKVKASPITFLALT